MINFKFFNTIIFPILIILSLVLVVFVTVRANYNRVDYNVYESGPSGCDPSLECCNANDCSPGDPPTDYI